MEQESGDMHSPPDHPARQKRNRRGLRRAAWSVLAAVVIYLLVAYLFVPWGWTGYMHRHPALANLPEVTHTADGHPGDPINVMLVGSAEDLHRLMLAGGWSPADPLTLKSSLKIAEGTVLGRSYVDAPVSSLYLWGRKQDFAFEQPVGNNPRQRHHVRFWASADLDASGAPAWAGAATYDQHVGLSHTTGEITHHIAPDVDTERDHLMASLKATGLLVDQETIANFQPALQGRNGGGDPWHTDGALASAVILATKP